MVMMLKPFRLWLQGLASLTIISSSSHYRVSDLRIETPIVVSLSQVWTLDPSLHITLGQVFSNPPIVPPIFDKLGGL